MKNGLLVVERIVLESLVKKERNLQELSLDTGFELNLLQNILPALLMRGIILYKRGQYSLNMLERARWIQEINCAESVKEEVKDLFTSLVNKFYKEESDKNSLKVKKVWMSEEEEKIFNTLLHSLETFITGLDQNRKKSPRNEKLHEKKVVIWGHANYKELATEILEAV